MGLFMQGHKDHNAINNRGSIAEEEDPVLVSVNRIEYFPHNDTLNAIYRCNAEARTRLRTCTFNDNVGNSNDFY